MNQQAFEDLMSKVAERDQLQSRLDQLRSEIDHLANNLQQELAQIRQARAPEATG